VEFHRSCGQSCRDLRASFQTGTTTTTESFILNHDKAGIGFISLANTIDTGIHASPAMDTVFLIDANTVSWKGIALFTDLLVETRSHDIQEPVKFRTILHLAYEVLHLLDREIPGIGQIFLHTFKKREMF
jgi:hypothetical protein